MTKLTTNLQGFGNLLDIYRGVQNCWQLVLQIGSINCLLGGIPIARGQRFHRSHRDVVMILSKIIKSYRYPFKIEDLEL